jgi:hypothetical protein
MFQVASRISVNKMTGGRMKGHWTIYLYLTLGKTTWWIQRWPENERMRWTKGSR